MVDEGSGPNQSIPAVTDTDAEHEQANFAYTLGKHRRLKKIFPFFSKTDELESSIHDFVKSMLEIEPTLGETPFELSDVSEMIHSFCQPDQVLNPQFLQRIPFPFRMLRLCLDIYLLDPVEDTVISTIRMTDDEKRNRGLQQLIWFLLLVGATPAQVENNLNLYRQLKSNANASSVQNLTKKPASEDRRDRPSSSYAQPNIQDARRNDHSRAQAPHSQSFRGSVAHATASGRTDEGYSHSKKGNAVDSYFKDRRFSGSPEQSVDNLIRDYEICAAQQCLNPSQMSLFFVNALADPARQFFLTHCSPSMPFEQIAAQMRRHYNSETRKLQLQSEMDSLDITAFMQKHHITDQAEGLTRLVDYINALAPQLPSGFGDDPHKTRYLRRAVMRLGFAQQPISQLTSARYTLTQFTTALQESLQLTEELARARAPELNYGQYVRDPREVRFSNSRYSQGRDRSAFDRHDHNS